jgi:hypothetical protein
LKTVGTLFNFRQSFARHFLRLSALASALGSTPLWIGFFAGHSAFVKSSFDVLAQGHDMKRGSLTPQLAKDSKVVRRASTGIEEISPCTKGGEESPQRY